VNSLVPESSNRSVKAMTRIFFIMPFLVLATSLNVRAQDDGPILMGDIVIRINSSTKAADCIRKQVVGVGVNTGDIFTGDEGIEWSVAESLKNAQLECELSDESLSLGENGDEDVVVSYSRARLQKDKPGHVTVSIAKPQAIAPGFYSGQIKGWFKSVKGVNHEGIWRITVAVQGRVMDSLRFDEEKTKTLRVGQTASLTAIVHTIGCDVGHGDLTLELENSGNVETALHIPVPLERSLDPRTTLTGDNAIGSSHPKWADSVVSTSILKIDVEFKDPENLHQAYEIKVQVPHCFEVGSVVARLKWDQSEEAPSAASRFIKGEQTVKVDGGIHVFPTLCSTNEPVTIRAVSAADLGPTIKLIVKGPKSETFEANLKKSTGADAEGAHTAYVGKFRPRTTGQWEVTWPSDTPKMAEAFGTPRAFEAWLEFGGDLAKPLTVFASATPVLWEVWGDPYQGRGWEETRPNALTIKFNEQYLKNVKFTPIGFFKIDESNGRFTRYDPGVEPTLEMVPQSGARRDKTGDDNTDGEKTDPKANDSDKKDKDNPADPKLEDDSDTEKTADSNSTANSHINETLKVAMSGLNFDAVVRVDRGNENHSGNTISNRKFYYRAMLEGIGPQGQSVQKIIMVPLNVTITTDWAWYKTKIWWGLAVLAFLVILYFIWRTANPPLKKTVAVESMIQTADPDGELGGFAGGPPQKKPAQAAESKATDSPADETSEPDPEPEDDDSDDGADDLDGFA
jgi:hypothetical protein